MKMRRRTWVTVLVLAACAVAVAWRLSANSQPTVTFVRGEMIGGFRERSRVIIENKTKRSFTFYGGESRPWVFYHVQDGAGWTAPANAKWANRPDVGYILDPDEWFGFISLVPDERIEVPVVILASVGIQPEGPFQVGVRCWSLKEESWPVAQASRFMRRWFPTQSSQPYDYFIWSETITP